MLYLHTESKSTINYRGIEMTGIDEFAKKIEANSRKKLLASDDMQKIFRLLQTEAEEEGKSLCEIIDQRCLGFFLKNPRKQKGYSSRILDFFPDKISLGIIFFI